jgi:hypothetical protein
MVVKLAPRMQRKFKVQTIRASRLEVDHDYQRELIAARVKAIADNLDLDALGVLIVNRRDGRLYIIDGQHRHAALLMQDFGEWEVTCQVYENLSAEEEAAIFVEANNTRKPSAYDTFKAGRVARDSESVAIDTIVRRHGLEVSPVSRDGTVACVSKLRQIYRAQAQGLLLDRTLGVALQAFGARAVSVDGYVLGGLSIVLQAYGDELDCAGLVQKLAKTHGGAPGLVGRARTLRDIRRASVDRLVAAVVVSEYNKGKRSGALPEL